MNTVPGSMSPEDRARHRVGRADRNRRRAAKAVAFVRRVSGGPWYQPSLAAVAAADYFVPFLPAKTLVLVTAVLTPRAWLRTAVSFAAGNVAGAVVLAGLAEWAGPPVIAFFFGDVSQNAAWLHAHALMLEWGASALFALSALPIPLRTAVGVCAVLDLPLATIAATVLAGRLLGFASLTYVCSHAPRLLQRWPAAAAVLAESRSEEGATS